MAEVKKTRSIGLKKICVGEVNPQGGMAAELTPLGKTFKGTASFTTEENSSEAFYSEEEPNTPEEEVTTEVGLKSLKWNLMEWDNEVLKAVFGGTEKDHTVIIDGKSYTTKKYVAPREIVEVEKSIRAISRYNVVIDIPRAKVTAKFNWNMTMTDIAQIEITAKALTPFGAEDGPYEIYKLGEPTPPANPTQS